MLRSTIGVLLLTAAPLAAGFHVAAPHKAAAARQGRPHMSAVGPTAAAAAALAALGTSLPAQAARSGGRVGGRVGGGMGGGYRGGGGGGYRGGGMGSSVGYMPRPMFSPFGCVALLEQKRTLRTKTPIFPL